MIDKIYNDQITTNKEVMRGEKDGYKWYIFSIKGSHPCAYVAIDKKHPYYKVDFENKLSDIVHGGITYNEETLNDIIDEDDGLWVFGWDYAHFDDYVNFSLDCFSLMPMGGQDWGESDGKKWSIDEIKEDIYSFISFLVMIKDICKYRHDFYK